MKYYVIDETGKANEIKNIILDSLLKMDIEIAEKILKVSKVYFFDWDEKRENPRYIPSGKPWRTHMIDEKLLPRFTIDPAASYQLKLKMAEKYHWLIKSPFYPGLSWFAGLTPHNVTGWNGKPDYEELGETEMEAVSKIILKVLNQK